MALLIGMDSSGWPLCFVLNCKRFLGTPQSNHELRSTSLSHITFWVIWLFELVLRSVQTNAKSIANPIQIKKLIIYQQIQNNTSHEMHRLPLSCASALLRLICIAITVVLTSQKQIINAKHLNYMLNKDNQLLLFVVFENIYSKIGTLLCCRYSYYIICAFYYSLNIHYVIQRFNRSRYLFYYHFIAILPLQSVTKLNLAI